MMIVGTALFWSYTALFAEALISEEILDVESELRSIERRLQKMNIDSLLLTDGAHPALKSLEDRLANIQRTHAKRQLEKPVEANQRKPG